MKVLRTNSLGLDKLCERNFFARKRRIEQRVAAIIDDVRLNGDDAVLKYTRRFDGVKFTARQLRVAESEISSAFQNITPDFVNALKLIINNVSTYYKKQQKKSIRLNGTEGVCLKEEIIPLDSVGIYIPAGTAPLVSTVYMTAVPAIIAGVKRIVIATPPGPDGRVNPYILAVANLLKVNEIYKVGGAQAIAALALGTRSIERVDKIVGPGNMYVTEAKRQVFGYVDIDMLAGPSELVVIANRTSNPEYVIADLEAQREHLGGLPVLVTNCKRLMKIVKTRVPDGFAIYVKNMNEAVDVTNRIAPEHCQVLTNEPNGIAKGIRHAGAVFLGPYSPTALGDYAAGPSHVLPTLGTARFFSGLNVNDFVKTSHVISYSRKALERMRGAIEMVAKVEGLTKHAESIAVRFK